MTKNTESVIFRWIHAQTLEKTDIFLSFEEALDFYFQRISNNLIDCNTMWWLELDKTPVRDSPLYSLISNPPFQQTNQCYYISSKTIFEYRGINSELSKYIRNNGMVRALFSKSYILGYELIRENTCLTDRHVTLEGIIKYINDYNISSYEINELSLHKDSGIVIKNIISSQ
jgi:hypothetical protein